MFDLRVKQKFLLAFFTTQTQTNIRTVESRLEATDTPKGSRKKVNRESLEKVEMRQGRKK